MKYVAILKDIKGNVVDGIEVTTYSRSEVEVCKAVSNYAYDFMAKNGMKNLSWDIRRI